MTTSTSREAYFDCFTILDRALEAQDGVRIRAETEGTARHQITRLNYARTLDRQQSREVHPADHPDFNTSVYDRLIIRQPRLIDGQWYVVIEPRRPFGEVEEIAAE